MTKTQTNNRSTVTVRVVYQKLNNQTRRFENKSRIITFSKK